MSELYHCAQCFLAFDSGYAHYLSGPNGDYGGETYLVCGNCGNQYRLQHARQAVSDRLDSQPEPITISPNDPTFAAAVKRNREKLAFLLDDENPSNWTSSGILKVMIPELLLEMYVPWTTVAERHVHPAGPVVLGRRVGAELELRTIACSWCNCVGQIVEWTLERGECPRCHFRGISQVAAYTT